MGAGAEVGAGAGAGAEVGAGAGTGSAGPSPDRPRGWSRVGSAVAPMFGPPEPLSSGRYVDAPLGGSGTTTKGLPADGTTKGLVPVGGANPLTVAEPALITARIGSEEVLASMPTMSR